ncbi:MAG: hypothetical protein IJB81_12045 [Clostridia bacterium]|nr:hypothetical protein [Clostridia bacterium]
MISMCPQCGSNRWNKTATATHLTCPECGHSWPYRRGPLLILTGCSGVGKTTTAICLFGMTKDFAVLDADMFYIPDDNHLSSMLEKVCNLSAAFNQQGTPLLWTLTGGLDLLKNTYHRRFFSQVKCLALTCESDELRRRMTEGRGITNERWLNGSMEYNAYFRTHDVLGDVHFDKLDITQLTPDEAAEHVCTWVAAQLIPSRKTPD